MPPDQPQRSTGRRLHRGWVLLVPAAAVILALVALTGGSGPTPSAMPSARIASPGPTVAAFPTTVDGLTVQSVGELLAARAAGKAPGGPYALKGYWSYPPFHLSCIPPQVVDSPPPDPGALQLDCNDGQYGITEDNEPYMQRDPQGNVVRASGPHLTPFMSSVADHARLFETPGPERIVVVGHFDDALASKCQPQARQSCLDRFVIERIVVFGLPTP